MTNDGLEYIQDLKIKTEEQVQGQEDPWIEIVRTVDPETVRLQAGELLFETEIDGGYNIYHGYFTELGLEPAHEFDERDPAEETWLELVVEEHGRDTRNPTEI